MGGFLDGPTIAKDVGQCEVRSCVFRMTCYKRLGILIRLDQFASFDLGAGQLTCGIDEVGIKGHGPFKRCLGALKRRVTTVRIGRIVVVAKPEGIPGGRVAGVQAHGALKHSDGVFVGLRIMRHRDAAEIQIVGLFILGARGAFGGIRFLRRERGRVPGESLR